MNFGSLFAFSTLLGTIIGAGMFGLPFVVQKVGVIPALFYFLALGGAVTLIHLFFGEICLRTIRKSRLVGYASVYLGPAGKAAAVCSTVLGVTGALLAYIILGTHFLRILAGSFPFVLSETALAAVFWAALSFFVLRGIRAVAKAELVMVIILAGVLLLIFGAAIPRVRFDNLLWFGSDGVFLPYGVILFALAGWSAVPEIAEMFKKRSEKKRLDNVIIAASLVAAGVSFLFALVVAGVSGNGTSQDALSGLIPFLGGNIVFLGSVFGLVAIASSFMVLASYLKNSLVQDGKMPGWFAAVFTITAPMALFLAGLREFISVLGVLGAVFGLMEALLIIAIFIQARKKGDREPEYALRGVGILPIFLCFLLAGGAVAQFLYHAR
ncbi:MAG: amino acid permease [Candidatus Wildermuthbacteria bacterium]|nr:amino acid permease [Candidatus Wildermuthbacteria bacterium]